MSRWPQKEIESGSMKQSLMTDTDRATMRWAVAEMSGQLNEDASLKVLEIGTYNGSTAWGIKIATEKAGKELVYQGIDVTEHDAILFPGAHFKLGKSCDVYYQFMDGFFDILFIDGPHDCSNCMLDFLHYSPKVRVGGLILFHDASPASQCPVEGLSAAKQEEYREGGWEIPIYYEFGTAVQAALKKLGLLDGKRTDFELVSHNWSPEPYGGISIYRRVA